MSRFQDRRGSKATRVKSLAAKLLAGEAAGLSIDFTDDFYQGAAGRYGSAVVKDNGTLANNFAGAPYDLLTYTSPSPKLCTGPGGALRYGPHNLALNSGNINGAAWVRTGATASTDTLTENTSTGHHQTRQVLSVTSGVAYSFDVDIAPLGRSYFLVEVVSGATDEYAYVDLTNGTIVAASLSPPTITALAGGTYRIRIRFTAASSSATVFIFCQTGSGPGAGVSYTGNGAASAKIGRAQASRYPADATYLETGAAAVYGLPFEWSVTGGLQGILYEPQATNLCLRCREFDNPTWAKNVLTATANQTTAPDGSVTADLISTATTGSAAYITQSFTVATTTTYAISVFAKKGASNWINVTAYDGAAGNRYWYNVNTGVVGSTVAVGAGLTNPTAYIREHSNGWYRCVFVITTKAVTNLNVYLTFTDADASLAWTSGGNGYTWHSQFELGSIETSPIETIGSTVTRAADDIKLAQASFPWNGGSGTLKIDGIVSTPTTSGTDLKIVARSGQKYIQNYLWVP